MQTRFIGFLFEESKSRRSQGNQLQSSCSQETELGFELRSFGEWLQSPCHNSTHLVQCWLKLSQLPLLPGATSTTLGCALLKEWPLPPQNPNLLILILWSFFLEKIFFYLHVCLQEYICTTCMAGAPPPKKKTERIRSHGTGVKDCCGSCVRELNLGSMQEHQVLLTSDHLSSPSSNKL